MCGICGCGAEGGVRGAGDGHGDHHGHGHGNGRGIAAERKVRLEADLLAKNDALAARNRAWLGERGVLAVNLMGAPGAGKTSLLEHTIRGLSGRLEVHVIEGDQETENDAARIRATGCGVVQINTGAGCHLDATMVSDGIQRLRPPSGSLLVVENVGNLVCPALFDLGEGARVVLMSVTEGEDKPLKYPHMFRAADLVLLTKVDLAPHADCDLDACADNARRVKPDVQVLPLSATRGQGMQAWLDWLLARLREEAPVRTA